MDAEIIEVTEDNVTILIDYYPTGYADENDQYGLVCSSNGNLPKGFLGPDGKIFMNKVGKQLWKFDSVL